MANDLNQCNFIGRLGKDVELRFTPGGEPIAKFSIAVGWKSKEKDGVEWVSVVAFGKLAEVCGKYLSKGSKIFVSGSLRTRKYEKNGEDRYVTEIRCNEMQMLDGRSQPSAERQQPSQPAAADQGFNEPVFDDDIPF